MGFWGEKPWENDAAADYCGKLETKPIFTVIDDGLNSSDVEEQRMAAWLVALLARPVSVFYPLRSKHTKLALFRLKDLRENTDWIEGWKNPAKIRKMIDAEIKVLVAQRKNCETAFGCPFCDNF